MTSIEIQRKERNLMNKNFPHLKKVNMSQFKKNGKKFFHILFQKLRKQETKN